MADYDRRQSGGGYGGRNNRKRRFREDDEDYDRRPRRRQDHGPYPSRIRKQLLNLAESPLRRWHEEVQSIAQVVTDNYDDAELRKSFLDLVLQLAVEQPLKTPFAAAVVLLANAQKPELVDEVLARAAPALQEKAERGEWRDVKLYLKFLACLQSCLAGDGVFPVLEQLFNRAVVLQTEDSVDTIGIELVKIILLTLPYIMAAAPGQGREKAKALLEQTGIIASDPHPLQPLVDPYVPEKGEESPMSSMSFLSLLQKQLQAEEDKDWPLTCLPRPWQMPLEEIEARERLEGAPKHELPAIVIPDKVVSGSRALFPEVFFSVYSNQDIESVPPVSNIASSLVRDGLLDTINTLHFNRNVSARYLIDLDCYFADGTFVKRATPFDRLRDIEPGRSTWKPEDVAVDTVFSQLFQLPAPEHKLVYYHSVLTEACKIAPAAIAPSLGRAIRYLYRSTSQLDLELSYRFLDWFSHHLSNFGFTWKWTEWVEDVDLPDLHPCKAFIIGALDKEVRLSFAQRIKNTLPEPLRQLIGPEKELDVPNFKFNREDTPFAIEGKEIAMLLKRKAPDEDFEPIIDKIQNAAREAGLDPVVASTDAFMTAVCWVGSKSLSHVLACIERTKDRLLNLGVGSDPEAARAQIISAVMAYWHAHPGVAISIVEKLLNYSILTPFSVVQWALVGSSHGGGEALGSARPGKSGEALAQSHVFEMVFNTVSKVTGRVRHVYGAGPGAGPAADAETREQERSAMRELFRTMDDALLSWATGSKDEMMEEGDGSSVLEEYVRRWGVRWRRVFQRRSALEEAFLKEAGDRLVAEEAMAAQAAAAAAAVVEAEGNGVDDGVE